MKKNDVLTSEEKQYLNSAIKGYKNDVIYIAKMPGQIIENGYSYYEYVVIYYGNYRIGFHYMYLPQFVNDTKFKNMKLYKRYTKEILAF